MYSQLRKQTAHGPGFTLLELLIVITVIGILVLLIVPRLRDGLDAANIAALKGRGRNVWVAIQAANFEDASGVRTSCWPKAMGFDKSRTSTEYFRTLLSYTNGLPSDLAQERLVADLTPSMLCGPRIPCAASAADFGESNNVWNVVCVGDDTPPDTAFLVTRNVDLGPQAGNGSSITVIDAGMFVQKRVVWITRGGFCHAGRVVHVADGLLFGYANQTNDVMYP